MGSKVKIGTFISVCDIRNTGRKDYPVIGINRDKEFMPTVANLEGVDISKYKVVTKGTFVFSGMQTGRDICIRIGLYDQDTPALISPAYTTFTLDEDTIIPEYFFMFFNREESDRYGWFISDSSVRANLDWPRFLEIEIPLPSPEEQQKVVNAWKACREIKEQNEAKAVPLKQLCQSYIQELKHKYPAQEIGPYMIKGIKNSNGKIKKVLGVGQQGFIEPQKIPNPNLKNYKIMDKDAICYAPPLYNIKSDAIHLYTNDTPAICSPIYEVFHVDSNKLLPFYLLMWLKREEFKRYAEFYSLGVRNTFNYELMEQVKIPIPPLDVQRAIVNIYKCANEAKQIAAEADKLSREVCPALLQHIINN